MDTDNNLILKQQRDRARQQIPVLPAVQPNFNAPPSPTDNQPGEPLLQPRAADTYQAPPTFDPLAPLDMSGLVEPSNTIVPTAGSTPLQIQDKLLAPLEQQGRAAIDQSEATRLEEAEASQDLSVLNYNPPNIDEQIAEGNARIDALSQELDAQERERVAQAQNKYQGQSLQDAMQMLDREPAEGSLAPVFKKVGDYFGGSGFTDPRDGRQYSTPYVALTQRALGLPETQKEGPPNIVGGLLYGLNLIGAAPIAFAKDRLDQLNRIQHNVVESMPWLKANQGAQTRWMQRNAPAMAAKALEQRRQSLARTAPGGTSHMTTVLRGGNYSLTSEMSTGSIGKIPGTGIDVDPGSLVGFAADVATGELVERGISAVIKQAAPAVARSAVRTATINTLSSRAARRARPPAAPKAGGALARRPGVVNAELEGDVIIAGPAKVVTPAPPKQRALAGTPPTPKAATIPDYRAVVVRPASRGTGKAMVNVPTNPDRPVVVVQTVQAVPEPAYTQVHRSTPSPAYNQPKPTEPGGQYELPLDYVQSMPTVPSLLNNTPITAKVVEGVQLPLPGVLPERKQFGMLGVEFQPDNSVAFKGLDSVFEDGDIIEARKFFTELAESGANPTMKLTADMDEFEWDNGFINALYTGFKVIGNDGAVVNPNLVEFGSDVTLQLAYRKPKPRTPDALVNEASAEHHRAYVEYGPSLVQHTTPLTDSLRVYHGTRIVADDVSKLDFVNGGTATHKGVGFHTTDIESYARDFAKKDISEFAPDYIVRNVGEGSVSEYTIKQGARVLDENAASLDLANAAAKILNDIDFPFDYIPDAPKSFKEILKEVAESAETVAQQSLFQREFADSLRAAGIDVIDGGVTSRVVLNTDVLVPVKLNVPVGTVNLTPIHTVADVVERTDSLINALPSPSMQLLEGYVDNVIRASDNVSLRTLIGSLQHPDLVIPADAVSRYRVLRDAGTPDGGYASVREFGRIKSIVRNIYGNTYDVSFKVDDNFTRADDLAAVPTRDIADFSKFIMDLHKRNPSATLEASIASVTDAEWRMKYKAYTRAGFVPVDELGNNMKMLHSPAPGTDLRLMFDPNNVESSVLARRIQSTDSFIRNPDVDEDFIELAAATQARTLVTKLLENAESVQQEAYNLVVQLPLPSRQAIDELTRLNLDTSVSFTNATARSLDYNEVYHGTRVQAPDVAQLDHFNGGSPSALGIGFHVTEDDVHALLHATRSVNVDLPRAVDRAYGAPNVSRYAIESSANVLNADTPYTEVADLTREILQEIYAPSASDVPAQLSVKQAVELVDSLLDGEDAMITLFQREFSEGLRAGGVDVVDAGPLARVILNPDVLIPDSLNVPVRVTDDTAAVATKSQSEAFSIDDDVLQTKRSSRDAVEGKFAYAEQEVYEIKNVLDGLDQRVDNAVSQTTLWDFNGVPDVDKLPRYADPETPVRYASSPFDTQTLDVSPCTL